MEHVLGWEIAMTCVYGKSSLCLCVCACMRISITICACSFVVLSLAQIMDNRHTVGSFGLTHMLSPYFGPYEGQITDDKEAAHSGYSWLVRNTPISLSSGL